MVSWKIPRIIYLISKLFHFSLQRVRSLVILIMEEVNQVGVAVAEDLINNDTIITLSFVDGYHHLLSSSLWIVFQLVSTFLSFLFINVQRFICPYRIKTKNNTSWINKSCSPFHWRLLVVRWKFTDQYSLSNMWWPIFTDKSNYLFWLLIVICCFFVSKKVLLPVCKVWLGILQTYHTIRKSTSEGREVDQWLNGQIPWKSIIRSHKLKPHCASGLSNMQVSPAVTQ